MERPSFYRGPRLVQKLNSGGSGGSHSGETQSPAFKPSLRAFKGPEDPPVIGREGHTANYDWLDLLWLFFAFTERLRVWSLIG